MSPPQVQYRQLGKCGLRVSVPILGAMNIGSDKWAPWVVNEDKALPLLKAAWDLGVTTIDTANLYSNGESERIIGKFIKQYDIPREKLVLCTKCYFICHDDLGMDSVLENALNPDIQYTRDYVNSTGLSRVAIFRAVDASLERLGTPYVDLLQIHRFDPDTPPKETMKALHDLVQMGKVRYIGASSMRTWQFAELQNIAEKFNWTKFVSMQSEYSLLYREEEREMIPYCNYHGVGLIPWGVMATGALSRPLSATTHRLQTSDGTIFEKHHSETDKNIIERVEQIAKKKGWSMSQVTLAWTNMKVASPIIGVSSSLRLEESIISEKHLEDAEVRYLEELYVPKAVKGHL